MFSKIRSGILFTAGLLLVTTITSAKGQTVNDTGEWLAFFAQGDIRSFDHLSRTPYKWWFDGQSRFLGSVDGMNQSIVRPGLGRSLSERITLWGGYAWVHNALADGDEFDEHRLWQQLLWSDSNPRRTILLRSRFEQRLLDSGDDLGLRFRQFVRFQKQLPQYSGFSLVAWDEVFFHLNDTDWGARSGFDQNRIFIGLGWTPTRDGRWRTEVGYLNQTINRSSAANQVNHIFSVSLFY